MGNQLVEFPKKKVFHLDIRTLALSVETFDEPITCLALRNHGVSVVCRHSHARPSLLPFSSSPVRRAAVSRSWTEAQGCIISLNRYLSITPLM